ncbi:ATP-binding cassette domain-containing protein [Alteromonas sp. a30]|uniref:ATP-binding cassette domain-containing protein n=1 Tax=Alteromonas sp. a30 TaxID=2730917 RepID=UPI0022816FFE|nr:ATP-binding cassette domain-containing protein [Alteromonas sp. a30]MCY7296321.1 ATP-binding cassette domain-containing protein [Alteromonas sp. a30]
MEKYNPRKKSLINLIYQNKILIIKLISISLIINLLALTPSLYIIEIYRLSLSVDNIESIIGVTFIALVSINLMARIEDYRASIFNDHISKKIPSKTNLFTQKKNINISKNQFINDVRSLWSFSRSQITTSFFDLPFIPIYLFALTFLHPLFGITTVLTLAILISVPFKVSDQSHQNSLKTNQHEKSLYDLLHSIENTSNKITSKKLNLGRNAVWKQRVENVFNSTNKETHYLARTNKALKYVRGSSQIIFLACGGCLIFSKHIDPIVLIAATILFNKALSPIDTLTLSWGVVRNMLGKTWRLEAELNPQNKSSYACKVDLSIKTVEIRELTFNKLHQVSVLFEEGKATGIIGSSGAGKSLLCRILSGVQPLPTENLFLNGDKAECYSQLSDNTCYVPQQVSLISGTVIENITNFGKVKPQQAINIAIKLGIHQEIMSLPQAYATNIDENKHLISTNLKTLIALATAVIDPPKILIFDNIVSSLDEVGEKRFYSLINELKKAGHIVIVTSYKKTLLANMDTVVVLNLGKITLQGEFNAVVSKLKQSKSLNTVG